MRKLLLSIMMYCSIFNSINFTRYNFLQIWVILTPFYIFYYIKNKKFSIPKSYKNIIIVGFFMFGYHFFIKVLSGSNNFLSGDYFKVIFRIFVDFFSANIIIEFLFKIKTKDKFIYLLKLYVFSIAFDIFLGILRYHSIKINEILLKINNIQAKEATLEYYSKIRILPLGAQFFGGGVLIATALIILVYIMNREEKKIYYGLYFFIAVFGIFVARTVIVGVILSIIYFLVSNRKKIHKLLKIIFYGIVLINILLLFINNKMYEWGMEFFLKGGKSTSTNTLLKMWTIIPYNIVTLFFGDGEWKIGNAYYMNTDVGYLRIIWYVGIIGLLLFFLLIFNFTNSIFKMKYFIDRNKKILIYFLVMLLLVVNLKGYKDIFFIFYLILSFAGKIENLKKVRKNV